jgi:AcrR family transcriptional regulator
MPAVERKRGRPTAAEKVERDQRILQVATDLFAELDFHRVSLDLIAARAGVAKRTLYDRYGGKPAVLSAAVRQLHAYAQHPAPHLRDACAAIVSAVCSDRAVGVHRAVIASADTVAAQAFFESGPRAAQQYLAGYLGGDLARAGHLFAALLGEPHRLRLLGLAPAPTREMVDRHVSDVLAVLSMS